MTSSTFVDQAFPNQQELVRWIDNKLGSNELWGGWQASVVLTREILTELETCFQELEPHIKLKIIQAMVHLSPKTLHLWKQPFEVLLDLASRDADDWVAEVASLYRQFPKYGEIQCSSNPDSYFNKTQLELERIVTEKIENSPVDFSLQVPPDCELMPKTLLDDLFSSASISRVQHFNMKGKVTKSTKLLEEVKKASEQHNNPSNKKNHGVISSFPIKIRSTAKKLDNTLPMKGIPTANALKMSSGFTNESKKYHQRPTLKRAGGAVLIDIAELPNPNRRRRRVETVTVSNDAEKCSKDSKNKDKRTSTLKKHEQPQKTPIVASTTKNMQEQLPAQHYQPPNEQPNLQPSLPYFLNPSLASSSTSVAFEPQSFASESQQPHFLNHFNNALQQTSSNAGSFENGNYAQAIQTHQTDPNALAIQQFEGLLKDANKLTPMTYNLILSFLSGNKNNPLHDKLGPVITLPFSETVEFEPTGAFLVEIFFQMDYRTGEWKRLRKARPLGLDELDRYRNLTKFGQELNQSQGNSSTQNGTSQWNNNAWNFMNPSLTFETAPTLNQFPVNQQIAHSHIQF